MPKKEQKPQIRFKGFTDDWEQRKLDDIADDIADGPFGSNLKAEHYTEEKEARIVQLSNIGETGWHDENVKYTTFTHAREISRSIVTPNSLIMAKMMPAGMTIICPNADKMYVLSSDAVKIKLKNNINATYFVSMTKSKEFLQQIDCDAQGSTRTRTSISKIRKMNVPVPELSEQTKIGAFFSKLDNLITLHQRKYEKLKNIKKSMLEKMFPKNENKIPEIRFKGFTDDWEQRKVSELAERYDNLRVPVAANLRVPGNTPYYGANGIQDYVTGYTHDGEYILVAEDGANDLKNYPVNYVNGRIWVNNHAHVLQGKKKISSNRFLSYAISLVDIESVLVGGGRAKLNAEVMMNLDVKLPSYGEQTKIGAFFSKLDNLITLHQRMDISKGGRNVKDN